MVMRIRKMLRSTIRRETFLPYCICDEVLPTKHFITQHLQIMTLIVINGNPKTAIIGKQAFDQFQPIPHQSQPDRMLNPIVIMCKSGTSVIGRVYENALDLSGVLGLEGLEGEKVVAEDELVVEEIVFSYSMRSMVTLVGIFDEDPWFEAGAGFFTDPGEFEFGLGGHGVSELLGSIQSYMHLQSVQFFMMGSLSFRDIIVFRALYHISSQGLDFFRISIGPELVPLQDEEHEDLYHGSEHLAYLLVQVLFTEA